MTFQQDYNISLSQISLLIAINFTSQLVIDILSAHIIPLCGTRASVVMSQLCAAVGISGMAYFPHLLPDAFIGISLSMVLCGVGGGLVEVIISPLAESCNENSSGAQMSILHSFYSWGQAVVVLFSTIFFRAIGIANWHVLAFLWALIPLINAVIFTKVPIPELAGKKSGERSRDLFKTGKFYMFILLMVMAGASEMTVSQWASSFAEEGLGVSKTVGDLLGPCLFAVLMGTGRILSAILVKRVPLKLIMCGCCVLCIIGYGVIVFSPIAELSLAGCAICGFAVSNMWPGVYSLAPEHFQSSVKLFSYMAFAGDIGCLLGPSIGGTLSDITGNMKSVFILGCVFPIIMLITLIALFNTKKKSGV